MEKPLIASMLVVAIASMVIPLAQRAGRTEHVAWRERTTRAMAPRWQRMLIVSGSFLAAQVIAVVVTGLLLLPLSLSDSSLTVLVLVVDGALALGVMHWYRFESSAFIVSGVLLGIALVGGLVAPPLAMVAFLPWLFTIFRVLILGGDEPFPAD